MFLKPEIPKTLEKNFLAIIFHQLTHTSNFFHYQSFEKFQGNLRLSNFSNFLQSFK